MGDITAEYIYFNQIKDSEDAGGLDNEILTDHQAVINDYINNAKLEGVEINTNDIEFCEFLANMQRQNPDLRPTMDDVLSKFQQYFSK